MSPTPNENQALFAPIHKAHAIVEMVIYCELAPALDAETLERLIGLKDELAQQFPVASVLSQTEFKLQFENEASRQEATRSKKIGVELKRLSSSAQDLEWMIRLTETSISIHCLNYSRWEYIWRESKELLQKIFKRLGATSSIIVGMGLKYIDRFVFTGTKEEYSSELLFQKNSKYLVQRILEVDGRWHSHSGWFQPIPAFNQCECLNQLKVEAAYVFDSTEAKQKHYTTIEHNQLVRPKEAATMPALNNDANALDSLIENLHHENKRVLSSLIVSSMSKDIKLNFQETESCPA